MADDTFRWSGRVWQRHWRVPDGAHPNAGRYVWRTACGRAAWREGRHYRAGVGRDRLPTVHATLLAAMSAAAIAREAA